MIAMALVERGIEIGDATRFLADKEDELSTIFESLNDLTSVNSAVELVDSFRLMGVGLERLFKEKNAKV
jgi:hypothetical protein